MQRSKQVASAWERLTMGQCNNDEVLPKARKQTVRSLKRQLWREKAEARAQAKFDKADALIELGTPEARKELRKLSDDWTKRRSKNVKGFHRATKASKATVTKGVA